MAFLQIEKLTYGHIKGPVVINDFSASKQEGVVFLFGEKGSGKTTLLELLCGINDLYFGKILIDGKTPKNSTDKITYLPSEPVLLKNKTVLENLKFACNAANKSQDKIDLKSPWTAEHKEIKVKKLSFADKQILCLERAKIKNAKLLLVDVNLSKIEENQKNEYKNALFDAIFAKNRLSIVAYSPEDFKKLQIKDKLCSVWYQNASKIEKYENFDDFLANIKYSGMLDYFDYPKTKGKVVESENGYLFCYDNRTYKLAEKYVSKIKPYFEVGDSADVYLSSKIDVVNLKDSELNNLLDSGDIMLFDAITTERLK